MEKGMGNKPRTVGGGYADSLRGMRGGHKKPRADCSTRGGRPGLMMGADRPPGKSSISREIKLARGALFCRDAQQRELVLDSRQAIRV